MLSGLSELISNSRKEGVRSPADPPARGSGFTYESLRGGESDEKTDLRPEFEPEGKPGPATDQRQANAVDERATSPEGGTPLNVRPQSGRVRIGPHNGPQPSLHVGESPNHQPNGLRANGQRPTATSPN